MQDLRYILHDKLLTWAKEGAAGRIIVARKRMRQAEMPAGVELTYRKIPGKRVIVKGGRLYGNTRLVSARWPEAGMSETENYRLICVVEGQVNFQAGNYQLGCDERDFILIPPGIPCGEQPLPQLVASRGQAPSCLLLRMISYRRGFQCWLTGYDRQGNWQNEVRTNYLFLDGKIISLFRFLMEEASGVPDVPLCDGLLLAFFSALRRETEAKHYLHPGPMVKASAPPVNGDDFASQLEVYIEQHLNQPLTLAQVARELYMSRTQFVRRVRKETGKSFVEFLTAYRIKEAQTLLRESEWTVQTIAQFVGFKSPATFHALFKRQTGFTPGEFRSQKYKSTGAPIKSPI